ncbi:MAG: sensor histidine kinase, partial [Chloroflexi bacterium]
QLYLSLIKRGVPEKLPHYLSVLDKEAGRLEQLIEGILNYSNLLIDKDDLEFCAVNFSQIVSDIVASLDSDIEKHQLTLHKNIDQSVPPINGSAEQLKLLVSHLVVNAIKYSKQGTITISVKSHDADKAVCLEVVDDGIGISPNEQNHIFERFYRGQKIGQSNIPGIGMGLAIVKEIVDIHNGRINVTSKKDVGSTFRIWLPTVNTTEEVHYAR